MPTFQEKLNTSIQARQSLLCVGLDPDRSRLEGQDMGDFLRDIIDATKDVACAYKPNLAFFEALGPDGLRTLKQVRDSIPTDIPVIGDAKRGDIGNTAAQYATALFDYFNFDAATINPYLGGDSLEPFLEWGDRGIFLLCRTSNPGARDLQDLKVDGVPLYQVVARKAQQEWNRRGNVGLVTGATYPDDIRILRQICPTMPFLVPGIGAQAGDLEAAVRASVDAQGRGAVINISRGVIFAGKGKEMAAKAREAAIDYRDKINAARQPARK